MKPDESVEDFTDKFLHLCYEFPEEDMDQDFCEKKFQDMVQISLNQFERKPLDVSSSILALRKFP